MQAVGVIRAKAELLPFFHLRAHLLSRWCFTIDSRSYPCRLILHASRSSSSGCDRLSSPVLQVRCLRRHVTDVRVLDSIGLPLFTQRDTVRLVWSSHEAASSTPWD